MYFIIAEEKKYKYDFFVSGVILDERSNLVPDIFSKGTALYSGYRNGFKIILDNNRSELGLLPDKLFTKVHVTIPLLVLSKQTIDIINKFHVSLELFSLIIENGPSPILDYLVVNILDKIDCIEYVESEISFERYDENDVGSGNIYTIDSLVLDHTKIPENKHLFLLGRYENPIVVISEDLKTAIENANLEGFVFINPENFSI